MQYVVHVRPQCDRLLEGVIVPSVSVPGLACCECGTWTGMRRIPQECPSSVLAWLKRRDGGPLSVDEMKQLNCLWSAERLLDSPANLLPGDIFPNVKWKIGRKATKSVYWPQFSNVLTEPKLFNTLSNMASGCLKPIGIANSEYVELAFCFHSNVLAAQFDGNYMSSCTACGKSECTWSESYKAELKKQADGKWMFSDNCLQSTIYLSHIFYPGFIVSPSVAARLNDFNVTGCAFDTIEIRQR